MKKQTQNQRGFSLIELMVGLVIVSFIWIGVAELFSSQLSSSIANQDDTELQASVQAVSHMISQDIVMSGFGIDGSEPFVHVNNASGHGDTLTVSSAAQFGSVLTSVLMTPGTGSGTSGDPVWVRCFGEDGWGGGNADPVRDFVNNANSTSMSLWVSFFDPFSGKRLTYLPVWTKVDATLPEVGGPCEADNSNGDQPSIDNNGDGDKDPMVQLTLNPSPVANIPNGTVVYGVRWPTAAGTPSSTVTWGVAGTTLYKNTVAGNVPVLHGVENFQVQYLVRGNPNWLNSLSGIQTKKVEQIRYTLLVRRLRKDGLGSLDPRAEIPIYDQSYTLSADDQQYVRQAFEFYVRPKNNGILLELTPPI